MFVLSEETIKNIEETTGKTFDEICDTVSMAENGSSIKFSRERSISVVGRGNPYLSRLMFTTLDEADREMTKLIGEMNSEQRAAEKN